LYGVLFCIGIAHWVYFAIAAYFPFSAPIALLCTLFSYSVFIGVYTGLAALFSCILLRRGTHWVRWLGVPALWVCGEFVRSTLLSGFSWELLGYTQYRSLALIQIADLTGVYGVSFLLALSGYVAAEIIGSFHVPRSTPAVSRFPSSASRLPFHASRFPWTAVACFIILLTATLTYGVVRLRASHAAFTAPPLRLALVHGNVPSTHRWQRVHYVNSLLQYVRATRLATNNIHPDLVIWPEFAVGFYPEQELALQRQLRLLTHELNAPLLFGAPRVEQVEEKEHFYNSAYLLNPGGKFLGVYDKIRLLPFAESRPEALSALLPHSAESPSRFTSGNRSTVFTLPTSAFGVTICYEATYPHLARRLAQNGAQFLVNISNDTWLAGEAASAQHFSMAVFRAIENRRGMARITTAGRSGFIDPFGRPYQVFDSEKGGTQGEIFPREDLTFYTRHGDWFVFFCMGFSLFALFQAYGAFFQAASNTAPAPGSVLTTASGWDRPVMESRKP
jgi:apolipoprotein N-acyltransferase